MRCSATPPTTVDRAARGAAREPAGGEQRAADLRAACRDEAPVDAGAYAEINAAVRAALPADAALAGDSSQVTYFGSVHYFDVPAPRRFCYRPGFATLGYGLPAGLGAAIGATRRTGRRPARRRGTDVLRAGTGDLVEQRLSVPVIVVDSGGYQEIQDQEAARGTSRRSASSCARPTSRRWPSRWARNGVAHHLERRPARTCRRPRWTPTARPSSTSTSAERTTTPWTSPSSSSISSP